MILITLFTGVIYNEIYCDGSSSFHIHIFEITGYITDLLT